jgi:peroxiredoxin
MAVSSTMLALGTPLPSFELPDAVSGNVVRSSEFQGKPLVVAFICNHCPYVKHIRSRLASVGKDYSAKGVGFVAISANDPASHPDDAPSHMAEEAKQQGYAFPYLFDESQGVAKAFRAACTPEFYLFDRAGKLVYRGQFDASRPANTVPVSGEDLTRAIDATLAGSTPSANQVPGIGCNIKWRKGNEPDYF